MAESVINVFLSSVTKELGSHRAEVAKALREKGLNVKIQEDFNTGDGTLLEKLDAYIQQCHAVICLMGDRYGAEPPDAERLRAGGARHSYTQWEYLIAQKRGKSVYVFHPENADTPRDPAHAANPEDPELAILQDVFWQTQIIDQGRDRTPFSNHTDLVRKVLVCDFVEAKHKAEEEPLPPLNTHCPYVGLRRFEEKDKAYFFGRTAKIDELIERIESTPLLLVTGNSGSGKSSIVRAGVFPKWREQQEAAGQRDAKAIVCTPNVNPFEGLWAGLVAAGIDAEKAAFVREPSPTVFRDLQQKLGLDAPLLIFVDQFEEMFTRIPERDKHLRDTFVAALVEAAESDRSNKPNRAYLRIVLAMRDDFFTNLSDHENLFAITDANLQRIIAMKGHELREIIEQPARRHGVRFQSGLSDRIIKEVEGRAGMLPLLQYTLEALWHEEQSPSDLKSKASSLKPDTAGGLSDGVLSAKSYDKIGGVTGALQQRVTHFYDSKTVEQQRAVRNILLSLVEVSESGDDAGTPVSKAAPREALAEAGSEEILHQLLTEERLLISVGGEENQALVEIAHEALIKGWKEFEQWVRESKEAIQVRNHLGASARSWNEAKKSGKRRKAADELWRGSKLERALELNTVPKGGKTSDFGRIGGLGKLESEFLEASQRDKKQKVRRLQMAVAFTSLIALAAVLAGIYAFGQSLLAQDARKLAEAQTKLAEKQKKQSDIAAGEGWLLRAKNARDKGDDMSAAFYAAKAVGFEGFGKAPPEEKQSELQVEAESPSQNGTGLGLGAVWNRLVHGNTEVVAEILEQSHDQHRRLLTPEHSLAESNEADSMAELAKSHPFLWSSVVASQHSSNVLSVAFSPDGQTLASGSGDPYGSSSDNSIRLWDVKSGEQKALLSGHSYSVWSVAFSPDGETLASGSDDK